MVNLDLKPSLKSDLILIRPLKREDFKELFQVASDPMIWKQHQNKDRHSLKNFTLFFNEALESKGALIIIDKKNGKVVGSSRFKKIDFNHSAIEIGWSFLSRAYWGGRYNRESKKLMVNFALKSVDNVIFYVNPKNFRSQRAMEKLGARKLNFNERPWVLPEKIGFTFMIDAIME